MTTRNSLKTTIAALLLLTGCLAETASSDALEPPVCPIVECAFHQGTCDTTANVYVSHVVHDDGAGCWHRTAVCYPKGTPAGCEPEDCYSETSLACGAEPTEEVDEQ